MMPTKELRPVAQMKCRCKQPVVTAYVDGKAVPMCSKCGTYGELIGMV